jgi:hypothetical protein
MMSRDFKGAMRKLSIFAALGVLMATASAWDARAQSALPDQSLMFNPNSVRQPTTPPATKTPAKRTDRKATQPAVAQPKRDAKRDTPRPAPTPAIEKSSTPVNQPTPGRVPFETGSIGLTTTRQYSNSAFYDGRVTPGFENIQTKSPSYFGFSLSVPTDKPSNLPLPFLPR